jgi:hypothetical protein
MLESRTFPTTGKTISVIFFWLLPCVLDALFLIKEGISVENIIAAFLIFGICAVDILPYKKPVKVIISPGENLLVYNYNNCFGQIRSRTINLKKAMVSFKYRLVNLNYRHKLKFSWRLLIYEGNYFKNRIVIRQDDAIGYSKDTLQQMFNLINECRDTLT